MIEKTITSGGVPMRVGCDGRCDKAWGICKRPRIQVGAHPDDYYYLPDQDLGEAPADPGTYEGGDAKPRCPDEQLNKWCMRQCERSAILDYQGPMPLPDFSRRLYNYPYRQARYDAGEEEP